MQNIVAIVLFAALIALGQVFFKKAALSISGGDFFAGLLNAWLLAAIALSGAAAVLWVWILQTMPLSRAYAFTSLVYIMVPLAAYVLLDETFSVNYALGCGLIIAGVIIAST